MEEEDWPQGDDEQWQHCPYSQPARHSVDPLGASSSGAHHGHHHQNFQPGRASDAGFYYTPEIHEENVAFHQHTDNSL
jgi:hypothetical protein